jgi:cysteine-rich secretory family protein
MGKRFVSGVILSTLVAGMLTISAGVAFAANATDEARFVSLINHERTSRGLHSLVVRSDLVSVARHKSDQMAAKGTIWHDSSTWNSVSGWQAYGENVGMGPSTGSDPVGNLHTAFMNSPEHRQNILYKTFNQVGIGVTIKDDTMYVTEIFVQRGSTYSPPPPTTTTRRTTTTTQHTTTTTHTYRPVASVTHTVHAAAKPKPKPAPVVAIPQTVDLLIRMVGMDSDHVDPATGAAAGF